MNIKAHISIQAKEEQPGHSFIFHEETNLNNMKFGAIQGRINNARMLIFASTQTGILNKERQVFIL